MRVVKREREWRSFFENHNESCTKDISGERGSALFLASAFGKESRQSHIIANTLRERRAQFRVLLSFLIWNGWHTHTEAKRSRKRGLLVRGSGKKQSSLLFLSGRIMLRWANLHFISILVHPLKPHTLHANETGPRRPTRSPLYLLRWQFSHKL
jgi:hypothetical protein